MRDIENFNIEETFKENFTCNNGLETSIKDLFGERRVITLNFDEKKTDAVEQPKSLISYSKLTYRIKNLMAQKINGVKYIRTCYCNRTILPKSLAPVFLIPTCDPEVSMIVVQFTSERSKKFSMTEFLTNQIQSLLAQNETSQCEENQNIWIPQFVYKGNYNECGELLENFADGGTGDDVDSRSYLQTAIIKAQLELNTPIFDDRIQITPKDEDIVINGDFLVGLVNSDLLQLLKIPLSMI